MFFHPEHLQEGRVTFFQKVQIARAWSIRGNDDVQWRLILTLNALRNEIAHGGKSEKRSRQITELRKILPEIGNESFRKDVEAADDKHTIVLTAAKCSGFLLELKADLIALRTHIDDLDEKRNPDAPRVRMPPHLKDDDN